MDLRLGHFLSKTQGVSEFWGPKCLGKILPKDLGPPKLFFWSSNDKKAKDKVESTVNPSPQGLSKSKGAIHKFYLKRPKALSFLSF